MALIETAAARKRRIRLNKSFLPFRPGQHAGFAASKPAIAMPGHKVVRGIPQSFGYASQQCQPGPGPAQTPCNFEGRAGTREKTVAIHQRHRVKGFPVQTETPQQTLSGFRLQGCKTKLSLPVAFKHPLNGSIAEVTYPVEQYYRKIKIRIHALFYFFAA